MLRSTLSADSKRLGVRPSERTQGWRGQLAVKFSGAAVALILRAVYMSVRWRAEGMDPADWPQRTPAIFAFWHGQQLMMPWFYHQHRHLFARPLAALISEHRDGRIIASAMNYFGIKSVGGSSSRGGKEALFRLIETLKSGDHIAITPDGPRGPLHKAKSGVIRIAQRSGAPIFPLAIASDRAWRSGSWDNMFLPRFFSRVHFVVGTPLSVPRELDNAELERLTALLEDRLSQTTATALQLLDQ